MRSLQFAEMLSVWERGWNRSPIDRGLLLLKAARPEASIADLERISIGMRDAELVRLRESTFGQWFDCRTSCDQCGEELEFEMERLSDLFETSSIDAEFTTSVEGVDIRCRCLNSMDLKVALDSTESESASRLLCRRSVVGLSKNGEPVEFDDLSENIVAGIEMQISLTDPHAETRIEISCPHCQSRSFHAFDIVSYFWRELEAHAKRQLWEVHLLARTYGWTEDEVLALTPFRRSLYVQMAQE